MGERYIMRPGKADDAFVWIGDAFQISVAAGRLPARFEAAKADEELSPFLSTPRRYSRLRMGQSAFAESRVEHARNEAAKRAGIVAEDWCDGIGPRVRICGLVAEPSDELDDWEIELS